MLGQFIAKKVAGAVIKKVMEKRAIKKMREYVEQPNELDIQMKVLQKNNAKLGKEHEEMQKEIAILRRDSHPSQEYICCRKCGCEIAKSKIKKR